MIASSIQEILSVYALGQVLEITELPGGYANTNYKVRTTDGCFLVRVCNQQPLHLIEYEIKLLGALRELDFPASYPYINRNGKYLVHSPQGPVMVYEFLEGTQPKLTQPVAMEIGAAVGLLSSFDPGERHFKENAVSLDNCKDLIRHFASCPNQLPQLFDYFIEQTQFLEVYLKTPVPRGIVHGDLFPNNTIFRNDQLVGIIDFEESAHDALLFDVGMTMNGFCFVDNQLNADLVEAFLKGYISGRCLTGIEWELLPYYLQWGAHGMLSWHLTNNLLYQKNQIQLNRVIELMYRVKSLRSEHSEIVKMIDKIWLTTGNSYAGVR